MLLFKNIKVLRTFMLLFYFSFYLKYYINMKLNILLAFLNVSNLHTNIYVALEPMFALLKYKFETEYLIFCKK